MAYDTYEHVWEWFDFEWMCKYDRSVYLCKRFQQLPVLNPDVIVA